MGAGLCRSPFGGPGTGFRSSVAAQERHKIGDILRREPELRGAHHQRFLHAPARGDAVAGMIWVTPPMLRIISGSPSLITTPWIVRLSLVRAPCRRSRARSRRSGGRSPSRSPRRTCPCRAVSAGPARAGAADRVAHHVSRNRSLPRPASPVRRAIRCIESLRRSRPCGRVAAAARRRGHPSSIPAVQHGSVH